MSMLAKCAAALVSAALNYGSTSPAFALSETTISGRWATQGFGSIVEFGACGDGAETMCGRIIWLWEPNDADGRPRADRENPDRALRGRPLVGIEIVRGLTATAPGVWSGGELYNPDDGQTYRGSIRLEHGALLLKGCAARIFCKTQTWRRLEAVAAEIDRLSE